MNSNPFKYTFSGHESFQCRHLWLKKGYDYILSKKSFSDEDAVVRLGVGKNMVSSIRYWMRAFNIIDNRDKATEFGNKLLSEDGYDPFLEDDASLWLLHYQLIKNGLASSYNIIFNEFRKEKIFFNKDTYLGYLKRRRDVESGLSFSDNTIIDDFGVFIKMYLKNDENKDIEDSFSGILVELDLIKQIGKGKNEQYQIENKEREKLPDEILLFSILDNHNFGNSINLSSLEYEYNGPCSIFCLNRSGLTNKISEIVLKYKQVNYTDHAGIKELQFKNKPNAFTILDDYYGK
jgi:hypothetical protein